MNEGLKLKHKKYVNTKKKEVLCFTQVWLSKSVLDFFNLVFDNKFHFPPLFLSTPSHLPPSILRLADKSSLGVSTKLRVWFFFHPRPEINQSEILSD
jgi:hypothetical protein